MCTYETTRLVKLLCMHNNEFQPPSRRRKHTLASRKPTLEVLLVDPLEFEDSNAVAKVASPVQRERDVNPTPPSNQPRHGFDMEVSETKIELQKEELQ